MPIERRYLLQCSECLSEMIWPLPTEQELSRYCSSSTSYDEISRREADRYINGETGWANVALDHGQKLAERGVQRNCCWVKIGCSYGFQAIEMRKLGYNAWGVEYSKQAVEFINRCGGQGFCGALEDHERPFQHIDVCKTQSVFEHMRDPYEAMRQIYKLLVPGALVFFQVPNWASLSARLDQSKWKWLAVPDHLHYFKAEPFTNFMKSVGYIIEDIFHTDNIDDVHDIFRILDVQEQDRTIESERVVRKLLSMGGLGDQFLVVGTKPKSGDLLTAKS